MADFNFTVRATDNKGAYADRQFSLTVNEAVASSVVDRFVVIGQNGLLRSADGVTWQTDKSFALNSYAWITYGNGFWIIGGLGNNPSSTTMRVANANTMLFNNVTVNFTPSTGRSFYGVSVMNYRKGQWVAVGIGSPNGGSTITMDEYVGTVTASAITLQYVRTINPVAPSNFSCVGIDYDPTTDTWCAMQNSNNTSSPIFSRTGSGNWTQVATYSHQNAPSASYGSGSLTFRNGLWIATGTNANSILTSVNGSSWVNRTVLSTTANYGTFASYANGRMLAMPMYTTTNGSYQMRESLNAGRTVANRTGSGANANFPQGFTVGYAYRTALASYGGQTIALHAGTSATGATLIRSSDDFANLDATYYFPDIGVPYSIAVRN